MKPPYICIAFICSLITSCVGENCTIPDSTDSGVIISDAEIINSCDENNECELKVSFDDGVTEESIDSSLYTVLSNEASGQCNVSMERNVTRDDASKSVHYNVIVNECGLCKSESQSSNLVLVAKIPDDYSITYSIERK